MPNTTNFKGFVYCTKAQYNALLTKDEDKIYCITDEAIPSGIINVGANLSGDGSAASPIGLSGNVTVQGNSFNSANQLVKLDESGKILSGLINLSGTVATLDSKLTNVFSLASNGNGALKIQLNGGTEGQVISVDANGALQWETPEPYTP